MCASNSYQSKLIARPALKAAVSRNKTTIVAMSFLDGLMALYLPAGNIDPSSPSHDHRAPEAIDRHDAVGSPALIDTSRKRSAGRLAVTGNTDPPFLAAVKLGRVNAEQP